VLYLRDRRRRWATPGPHRVPRRQAHRIPQPVPHLRGYLLLAPIEHRERIIEDFSIGEHLELQDLAYRLGQAVSSVVPTERLYLLSLGSQQGNRHVHWHIAPLPPGVPYNEQQFAALMADGVGYLDLSQEEQATIASWIAAAMSNQR